jgi:hypothetical protein
MLRGLPAAEAKALSGPFPGSEDGMIQARRGLLRVASRR